MSAGANVEPVCKRGPICSRPWRAGFQEARF